jgi:hypothetical protein
MAVEGELDKEVVVHRRGYEGFITLMKWGAVLSLIVGLIVVFVIAN